MSHQPKLLHCHMMSNGTHVDRYLFSDGKVRYIEIPENTYLHPSHPEPLPPIIPGDWNWGILGRNPRTNLIHLATKFTENLQQVKSTWHPDQFDHRTLGLYDNPAAIRQYNLYMPAKSDAFDCRIVVKLAHTEDKIPEMQNECDAYERLEGLGIAPRFLGYVTEDGRKIGFIVERIEGARHAELRDQEICYDLVGRLHAQGIAHNDCHGDNILVKDGRAFLIDFETANLGGGVFWRDWDLLDRTLRS